MIVVDASYILKKYDQIGVLGKGRDFVHSISSQIYLMKKKNQKKDKSSYALQIYDNLGQEIYKIKVQQLQQAMFEKMTTLSTRIILLGKIETLKNKIDLYVLYEFSQVDENLTTLLQLNALNELEAKNLLTLLSLNFQLQARYTNEFLDISPQNIFVCKKDKEIYYVISNFGLTFQGSKFHRTYIPSTDPFFKQSTLQNVYYSYSFMAALVTLLAMTKIDAKDLFFDDGQFKANLLRNILDNLGDEKQTKEQLLGKLPLTNKKIALPYKYSKEFLQLFLQLLSIPTAPRSVFQQLVTHPENILELSCPYFDEKDGSYTGQGNFDGQNIVPSGNGSGFYENDYYCGLFDAGEPTLKTSMKYKDKLIIQGMQNQQTWVFDNKMVIVKGEFDEQFNADGPAVALLVHNQLKLKKQTIIYIKGQFQEGKIVEGKSYQRDKSIFSGKFNENQPSEGTMKYQNNSIFQGNLENLEKIKGVFQKNKMIFKGDFLHDQIKNGTMTYADQSVFKGTFINGEKSGFGIFTFAFSQLKYKGEFKQDKMDGEGILVDEASGEEINVNYKNGLLVTNLPDTFKNIFAEIKLKKQEQIQGNEDDWEDEEEDEDKKEQI